VPVLLDHLAANRDPGYEGLEGGHRAARYLLAPSRARLAQFGGLNTMQPDELIGDDNGVAVDDLGRSSDAIGTEREISSETPEHRAPDPEPTCAASRRSR
jgi:hypothetical protein